MQNQYNDWYTITDRIPDTKNLSILELGCGLGTQHLLDKFKFVYSYETNTRDPNKRWFNMAQDTYSNKNWKGYFDDNFPTSPVDINLLVSGIKKFVDLDSVDVIFIDPGFHNRAECVLYFARMLKHRYIFVHDTLTEPTAYNWALLANMPEQYKLIHELNI
jgi:SAM-dependent methyltransferase